MRERQFPIETQIGTFQNEEDLDRWLLKSDDSVEYAYDYCCFVQHASYIYTSFVAIILNRFQLFQKGIQSFGDIYEDLPAWWVDVINFMPEEIEKVTKFKTKIEGAYGEKRS